MAQEITNIVFVNSVRSKSSSERPPQVVPDDSSWNRFAKGDLSTRASFFEPPPQCVVVHLVGVLVKNEPIRVLIEELRTAIRSAR